MSDLKRVRFSDPIEWVARLAVRLRQGAMLLVAAGLALFLGQWAEPSRPSNPSSGTLTAPNGPLPYMARPFPAPNAPARPVGLPDSTPPMSAATLPLTAYAP